MLVYPLESRLAKPGDSIIRLFTEALSKSTLGLRTNDVLAVSSKIVAISENSVRRLDSVQPTRKAKRLAKQFSIDPMFTQVVLEEADSVIGGVTGALLTIKDGDAVPNAGVDRKNAPGGSIVLWPHDADRDARTIRRQVKRKFGKNIGVVIVDSRVAPLRLGTTGFAIGISGFHPVGDMRGTRDLSWRKMEITFRAIADGLASAAQLVMGEGAEGTPFALVRGSGVELDSRASIREARLVRDQCLYMSQIPAHRLA